MRVYLAAISAGSSGANAIVAAQSGKIIRVLSYTLSAAGTVNAKWQSASTDKSGLHYMITGHTVAVPYSPEGWVETAKGEALNLNLSGATVVGGVISYAVLT